MMRVARELLWISMLVGTAAWLMAGWMEEAATPTEPCVALMSGDCG